MIDPLLSHPLDRMDNQKLTPKWQFSNPPPAVSGDGESHAARDSVVFWHLRIYATRSTHLATSYHGHVNGGAPYPHNHDVSAGAPAAHGEF